MKVRLEKEDKKYITLEEAPVVRDIIAYTKEDTTTVEEYAEMAIRAAYNGKAYDIEVMKVSARIAKNARAWNAYNDHSETIDVWVDATAYVNDSEFIIIGAYLSDIWQITGRDDQEVVSYMYVRKFKEVK